MLADHPPEDGFGGLLGAVGVVQPDPEADERMTIAIRWSEFRPTPGGWK